MNLIFFYCSNSQDHCNNKNIPSELTSFPKFLHSVVNCFSRNTKKLGCICLRHSPSDNSLYCSYQVLFVIVFVNSISVKASSWIWNIIKLYLVGEKYDLQKPINNCHYQHYYQFISYFHSIISYIQFLRKAADIYRRKK